MINTIIISAMITLALAFIIENFRLNFHLRRVYYINIQIKNIISKILKEEKYFDVFTVSSLRKTFNEEFLKTHIIDKYEIYKIDDSRIKLIYIKGYVIEELEILSVDGSIEMKEVQKQLNN